MSETTSEGHESERETAEAPDASPAPVEENTAQERPVVYRLLDDANSRSRSVGGGWRKWK